MTPFIQNGGDYHQEHDGEPSMEEDYVSAEKYAALLAENGVLKKGIVAVQQLIEESSGVVGLHRNGDIAYWGDLREGGRYDSWLFDFDQATKV